MSSQVRPLGEVLVADNARVWFFASVSTDMIFEVHRQSKAFAAPLAPVPLLLSLTPSHNLSTKKVHQARRKGRRNLSHNSSVYT